MRQFASIFLVLLPLALSPSWGGAAERPNFVFILIDDLGWNDVGYNGSTFHKTPHIDRLAATSMRFDWAYAASPMCSPTRASIFTGKHPARHGITQYLRGWRSSRFRVITPLTGQALAEDEFTIGKAFKEAGYTTAFMGKWHMGPGEPSEHGFDVTKALIRSNHCAMYYPFRGQQYFEDQKEGDYFNDKLTDEAIKFIDDCRDNDAPFFLYLAHFAMHSPIESKPDLRKKFAKRAALLPSLPDEKQRVTDPYSHKPIKPRQDDPEYAGELENLDENIGRLVDHLEKSGLDDETVVVFTADNGGRSALEWFDHPTSVQPLRGGKTFVFEGGLRVPLLVRWPGVTKPGSICKQPAISMDFYPTLLNIAGLEARTEQHVDGVSLVPALRGGSIDRDTLYWHFPHYQGEGAYPASAVRHGHYKLIRNYHFDDELLFDLKSDPYETRSLLNEEPRTAANLRSKLNNWVSEIGAEVPVKNTRSDITDDIQEKYRDK